MNKLSGSTGFTLIELLVVISIIGTIIGFAFVAFQETKKSARDTQRKADLEDVRSALEVFKADCGNYPSAVPNSGSSIKGTVSGSSPCSSNNTYMFTVPGDPSAGRSYYYGQLSTTTYELCAALENIPSGTLPTCGGSCGETCNYKVTNP